MKKTILLISSLLLVSFAYAGDAKDKAACPKEKAPCCCKCKASAEKPAADKGSCAKDTKGEAKEAEAPAKK